MSDLEWMALRAQILFAHDAEGRLSVLRQPAGGEAPRFYLGRSRHGNVWRFRRDLDVKTVRSLARLASRESPLSSVEGVPAPPERIASFREVLERVAPIETEHRGPGFAFPETLPDLPDAPGRLIDETEEQQPSLGLELAGQVVSVCHASRLLPGTGAEAGLETLEDHRGCGHAPRVVAAWARAVRELGDTPFYSTTWENHASRAVAARLGLRFLGEDLHFT